jgi:hypothetical protein
MNVPELESLYSAGGNVKWSNHYGKVWWFFKKLNNHMTQHSNSILRYTPKRIENIQTSKIFKKLYKKVQSSTINKKSRNNPNVHQQMNG